MKIPKITIKFFLNTKLAPLEDEPTKYPLYIWVTFRRQTTSLKSRFGDYYESLDIVRTLYPEVLKVEERVIRKIIEREYYLKEDNFTLRGFPELYDRYSDSIWGLVSHRLKEAIKREMYATGDKMAIVPNYEEPELTVNLLRLAAIRLIPDFDKIMSSYLKAELEAYMKYMRMFPVESIDLPMAIEWENGEHRKEVKQRYKEQFGENPEDLAQVLGMIDKSVM